MSSTDLSLTALRSNLIEHEQVKLKVKLKEKGNKEIEL